MNAQDIRKAAPAIVAAIILGFVIGLSTRPTPPLSPGEASAQRAEKLAKETADKNDAADKALASKLTTTVNPESYKSLSPETWQQAVSEKTGLQVVGLKLCHNLERFPASVPVSGVLSALGGQSGQLWAVDRDAGIVAFSAPTTGTGCPPRLLADAPPVQQ